MVVDVDVTELAQTLYDAPYALLMHNRFQEGVSDEEAVYTYVNKVRTMQQRPACSALVVHGLSLLRRTVA